MEQTTELKVQKIIELAKVIAKNQIILQERAKKQEVLIRKILQVKMGGNNGR